VIEWTKIAACAERPAGVAFWRLGDSVANWTSRILLPPRPTERAEVPTARPLLLFDGVCLLCSSFVQFVIDHDVEGAFDFAPLQGTTASSMLAGLGLSLDLSTVVLIDEAGVHTHSTAALRVLSRCGLPYALIHHTFIWLPSPLRDAGYQAVAAVRYRLFGQDDGTACRLMTKALRQRFLD